MTFRIDLTHSQGIECWSQSWDVGGGGGGLWFLRNVAGIGNSF